MESKITHEHHCWSTCHATRKTVPSGYFPVRLAHPAPQLALHPTCRDWNCVSLVLGHDYGLALDSGHILWVCSRKPAAKQRFRQFKKMCLEVQASESYQFSYLGSLLTMPSRSKPARMLAVSSGVPVTTWTLAGLHSSTAPFTKSATAGGSEAMEARDRTFTPTLPGLRDKETEILKFKSRIDRGRGTNLKVNTIRQNWMRAVCRHYKWMSGLRMCKLKAPWRCLCMLGV